MGYTNQFNHVVVKVLVIQDGSLVDVSSTDDYFLMRYRQSKGPSLKTRLKNCLIGFLMKL